MIKNKNDIERAIAFINYGTGVCTALLQISGINGEYFELRTKFQYYFTPQYMLEYGYFWPKERNFIDVRITALLLFIEAYNSGDLHDKKS